MESEIDRRTGEERRKPTFQYHEFRGRKCLTCDRRECTGFGQGHCPCCGRPNGAKEEVQPAAKPMEHGI